MHQIPHQSDDEERSMDRNMGLWGRRKPPATAAEGIPKRNKTWHSDIPPRRRELTDEEKVRIIKERIKI